MGTLHLCPRCQAPWPTEWLADHCADCLPYDCDRCGALYPDSESAWLCCRD